MTTNMHMHTVALSLLARPALEFAAMAFVEGLTTVADLLWQGDCAAEKRHSADASTPDTAAFIAALDLLVPDAVEAGAEQVAQTLCLIQKSWRELPGAAIRVMAKRLGEVAPGTPEAECSVGNSQHKPIWSTAWSRKL